MSKAAKAGAGGFDLSLRRARNVGNYNRKQPVRTGGIGDAQIIGGARAQAKGRVEISSEVVNIDVRLKHDARVDSIQVRKRTGSNQRTG